MNKKIVIGAIVIAGAVVGFIASRKIVNARNEVAKNSTK